MKDNNSYITTTAMKAVRGNETEKPIFKKAYLRLASQRLTSETLLETKEI
jgi:hypothetical protein